MTESLLVGAMSLHAGFQLTVTLVVYPALFDTPAPQWADTARRHARRITPLVVIVYGAALVGCATALTAGLEAGVLVASAATLSAVLITAAVAGPTHAALGSGPDPMLLTRLRRADSARCAASVIAVVGAVAAACQS